MTGPATFQPPAIDDDDIQRVCRLLDLPECAFCGADGCDPRADVIKCMDTMDVSACPGSGKTTLLVAKLAILAEKWPHRTRGICVLSHTNAARKEIETQLGNTDAGRSLLAYPHFIGTIQGFVDRYLALPWLRSLGYSVKVIDSDIARAWRWSRLGRKRQWAIEQRGNDRSVLTITSAAFTVKLKGIGPHTPTYKACCEVCRRAAQKGYFCYDEMFVWARSMLDCNCEVVHAVRERFPVLFIDEVQDNIQDQSEILHRIFMDGESPVIQQRFGDPNQAIFDRDRATEAATDPFPHADAANERTLPNSHRFGQGIADLADPLGIEPYCLRGQGPRRKLRTGALEGRHTIFLFEHGEAHKVLAAYGDLLLETFSDDELREGTFTAVGHRHSPSESSKPEYYPHHVADYCSAYDHKLAGSEPKPGSLSGYVHAGLAQTKATGEFCHCVEKTAEGLLRLLWLIEAAKTGDHRSRRHRYIMELLEDRDAERQQYLELLKSVIVERAAIAQDEWNSRWVPTIKAVVAAMAQEADLGADATEFLAWEECTAENTPAAEEQEPGNVFRYVRDGREVAIRLGSIHSVKGETHTATLVLETLWNRPNLVQLRDWLEGTRSGLAGGSGPQKQQRERLKVHYVAMTRPTHLLCLAMRRDTFGGSPGLPDERQRQCLKDQGWHVEYL